MNQRVYSTAEARLMLRTGHVPSEGEPKHKLLSKAEAEIRKAKFADLAGTLAWQIEQAKLPTPEREYRWHATRRWRFDLCWVEHRLAVECDGGIWAEGGGGHTRGRQYLEDRERDFEAGVRGWWVIRVVGEQIRSGQALNWIERALAAREAA